MKRPTKRLGSGEVISAAKSLIPVLRDRADETDKQRRVPEQSFREMQDAELFHALKPSRYGGFELGLFEYVQISMDLGRGCGATAWVYSLLEEHCWFISLFPEAAQDDIWGDDSYALSAASIAGRPTGMTVERAAGGYRISGRFPFASGSDHAQWLLLGAPLEEHGDAHFFLVPKHELSVIDDWFVLGMRGSGSRSYQADRVFVPDHRIVNRTELFEARTEGPSLHPTFALLQSPRMNTVSFVAVGPTVGVAIGAVEWFTELVAGVTRRTGRLVESESMKLKLAESAAEADAARLMLQTDAREAMALIEGGKPLPRELQVRMSRNSGYAGMLSLRAVSRLHTALGTMAIFDGNPIQRALRDVHTGVAQIAMHWEPKAIVYADYLLGLDGSDQRVVSA